MLRKVLCYSALALSAGGLIVACGRGGSHGISGGIPTMTQAVCSGARVSDDFVYRPGVNSSARAFGRDGTGFLYVAGWGGTEDHKHYKGIVRKSTDNGASWATVDEFQGPADPSISPGAMNSAMAVHPDGRIWVGTSSIVAPGKEVAGVRFSPDRGATWNYSQFKGLEGSEQKVTGAVVSKAGLSYFTVNARNGNTNTWYVVRELDVIDKFSIKDLNTDKDERFTNVDVSGLAVDYQENIYVAGTADEKDGMSHWLVRKSADGGKTWNIVDDFMEVGDKMHTRFTYDYPDGTQEGRNITMAKSIISDGAGNIYVAGHAIDDAGPHWIVRRSVDRGDNWDTVDTYRYADQKTSTARFILDFGGTPVILGMAQDKDSSYHWVARAGLNLGSEWKNSDDAKFGPLSQAFPYAGSATSTGDMFIVGDARDGDGVNHWTVRQATHCQ